ncbi:unnamed protein product [Prunus armeniaca]|nr:hypothetical protein GBA52_020698 [Prunus armeniaca]
MKRHANYDLPTTHDTPRPGKVLKLKKVDVSKGGKREASIARSPRRGVGRGRGRRSRKGRTNHGRSCPPIMVEANLTEVRIEEGPSFMGLLSGNECNEQNRISGVLDGSGWPAIVARPQ